MSNRIALTLAVFVLLAAPAIADLTPQPLNLVQLVSGAPQILIAAAGAAQGVNGTFFRSDVSIINLADREQRVELYWLPQGGHPPAPTYINIAARSGVSSEDFVTNVLEQQGLGAILISAVAAGSNQLDTAGTLLVTSRIWTPQPAVLGGTTSQSFNTIPVRVAGNGASGASIFGLRRDSRYRLNVGVVNMHSTFVETYQITVVPAAGGTPTETYTITVEPLGMGQISLNAQTSAVGQVLIQKTSAGLGSWAAYGSSTDNVTGDSWSELAIPSAQ